MRTYKTTQVFVAACAGLAFFGVAMLSLGPILGQLNAQVEGANSLPIHHVDRHYPRHYPFPGRWWTVSDTNGC